MAEPFFTVEIDDTTVRARLNVMTAKLRREIVRAVTGLAIEITRLVREKLTGPVLKERTHHLHDSIHYEVSQSDGAITATIGTNVPYGGFWEFGFTGTEQVREHLRKMTQAFGRPVETPRDILVRAHERHVDPPARSYLRSTLHEEEGRIRETLDEAATAGTTP